MSRPLLPLASRAVADGVSLSALLEYIDPDELAPDVVDAIEAVGPAIAHGLNLTEAAELHGHRKDWARDRVDLIRDALLEQAQRRLDDMPPSLRVRVVAEIAARQTPKIMPRRRPARVV